MRYGKYWNPQVSFRKGKRSIRKNQSAEHEFVTGFISVWNKVLTSARSIYRIPYTFQILWSCVKCATNNVMEDAYQRSSPVEDAIVITNEWLVAFSNFPCSWCHNQPKLQIKQINGRWVLFLLTCLIYSAVRHGYRSPGRTDEPNDATWKLQQH